MLLLCVKQRSKFLCSSPGYSRTSDYLLARSLLADAVLLLESNVLLDQGVDAVDHALDQLHLGVAQSVLVGDVVSDSWIHNTWKLSN